MEIVGLVGFAGVVVFSLLYIVFFFKGASLKIPAIGMAVFALVLATAVVLTQMGIMTPGNSAAGEPAESSPAGGGPSEPASEPVPESEPALTSTPIPEESAPASAPAPTPTPTPTPAPTSTPAQTEKFEQILTGSWSNARRGIWGADEDAIFISSFHFSAAGEISIREPFYVNAHAPGYAEAEKESGYSWGGDEYGWFIAPMGHTHGSGTYSLTALGNGRFALETNIFWPVSPSDYLDQYTYELTYVNDNTLLIDGVTYVRGSDYTLAELARIFGFDIEY